MRLSLDLYCFNRGLKMSLLVKNEGLLISYASTYAEYEGYLICS